MAVLHQAESFDSMFEIPVIITEGVSLNFLQLTCRRENVRSWCVTAATKNKPYQIIQLLKLSLIYH